MSADKRAKIIQTVKKLIVHQESAARIESKEEAEAFASKITALMREYRIERHEVEPSVIDAMDFTEYRTLVIDWYTGAGDVPWQAFMFSIIAEANACQTVIMNHTSGKFMVAGQNVDLAVSVALARQLCKSIDSMAELAFSVARLQDAAVRYGATSHSEYIESYRTGFMQAIKERLAEDDKAANVIAEPTALVKLKDAVVKTEKYLARVIDGDVGEVSTQITLHHRGAAEQGYMDGKRADLNANRIENSTEPEPKKEIAS